MRKRTTIEIDHELLDRARRLLGQKTARATVEEALRRAADGADGERNERAVMQQQFLDRLASRVDTTVLAADEMWR